MTQEDETGLTAEEQEEAGLTAEEIEEIKSDMVELAARLERLAARLQGPARMAIPAEHPEPPPSRRRKGGLFR
jgi:hypothetical protein